MQNTLINQNKAPVTLMATDFYVKFEKSRDLKFCSEN